MKKSAVLMLVLAIVMAMLTPIGITASAEEVADSPELLQLAEQFNNCSTVQTYKTEFNCVFVASVSGNILNLTITGDEVSETSEYVLDGNILSATISEDQTMAYLAVVIVADCVGQMNGYEDGELFDTLNSDEITSYTVDKEGFEIKEVSGGNAVKIDITKKIPLVDLSKIYITTDDLDPEIVAADDYGSLNGNKTKLAYYISVSADGKNEIYIGEENEITSSTYNSILSVIEVMFGSKDAVNYFTENYADVSVGDKVFPGFIIKLDAKNENDISLLEDKKIAKVSVDKQLVNNILEAEKTASYKVIEGDGQTYIIGQDDSATFKIDADYVLFENGGKVYVDGKLVSVDNYTSESGSTAITLKKEYMDALSEGEHTLKVVFGNDKNATADFNVTSEPVLATGDMAEEYIEEEAVTEDTVDTAPVATTAVADEATDTIEKSPVTGDNNSIVYISLALISLLGMALTVTVSKKSEN